LEQYILSAVEQKPCGHHFFETNTEKDEKKLLGAIGG
jgi:hypothetical protein